MPVWGDDMPTLPPLPTFHQRTPAEQAVRSVEWEQITADALEQMERGKRRYASWQKCMSPAAKVRHAAQTRAGKVRRLVIDLDEAQRWTEAMRMLEAFPFEADSAANQVIKLQKQLAGQLEKVRDLAAGGCDVSRALLQELEA
jgi:hypothetical protein